MGTNMDIPWRATLPLLGVGGITLLVSLLFCCYLWRLRRQARIELGYKQSAQESDVIDYQKKKVSKEICPVCLDEFKAKDKVAVCPCKHVFHCKCLMQWLEEKNSCPMCKAKVRPEPGENTGLVHGLPVPSV